MKNLFKNEQSGRSMVEMLGVLAIIGVLSVGGISGYSKAMSKFKISKTMDQVSMLVANIRTMYSGQRDYAGLTNAVANNLGIIPTEMQAKTSGTLNADRINNAFGGDVDIATDADDTLTFTVAYADIPREACVSIITSDWGSGSSSGLHSIEVTGDGAGIEGDDATWDKLPYSPAEAAGYCGDKNTITWTYN